MKVKKKTISAAIIYIVLSVIFVIVIFPVVYTILGSFKGNMELLTEGNSLFPKKFVLENYVQAWNMGNFAKLTILALQYPDSGKLSTDVPDVDTGIDWLVYLAQYSLQCQAQSRFVVRSRLDIVENTEIMAGPNQSFYCGTL